MMLQTIAVMIPHQNLECIIVKLVKADWSVATLLSHLFAYERSGVHRPKGT